MNTLLFLRANFEMVVCALSLTVITITLFAGVICRYFTTHSIVWIEEVARFALIWLTFFGAAWLTKNRSHIRLDSLEKVLPPRVNKALDLIITVMEVVFACCLVIVGLRMVRLTWLKPTPSLQAPTGAVYLSIPLAGISMIIHNINHFTRLLRQENHSSEEPCQ